MQLTKGTGLAAAVTAFMILGCGGFMMESAPEFTGGDNVAACRAYVEAYNATSCIPIDLDVGTTCPDSLGLAGVPDMSAYYACLGGVTCAGPIPEIPDCSSLMP